MTTADVLPTLVVKFIMAFETKVIFSNVEGEAALHSIHNIEYMYTACASCSQCFLRHVLRAMIKIYSLINKPTSTSVLLSALLFCSNNLTLTYFLLILHNAVLAIVPIRFCLVVYPTRYEYHIARA